MMTPLTEVVEGWTGALPFTLNADGDPVDLTGMIVTIVLKNADGTVVNDSSSGITVTNATGGEVTYAPTSSAFVATKTPYKIRFRVVDAVAKTVYFPNEDEDLILVNVI